MPVSATLKSALFAQETGEIFIILLTLSNSEMAFPIRVCSDNVNLLSRGEIFIPYPFDLQLPLDDPDNPPSAKIVIDNVDRAIIRSLRTLTTPLTVLIEIVRAGALDTVEVALPNFQMRNISYDAITIEGVLSLEFLLQEPFPAAIFDPGRFPGGF